MKVIYKQMRIPSQGCVHVCKHRLPSSISIYLNMCFLLKKLVEKLIAIYQPSLKFYKVLKENLDILILIT